jgi:hypothetical protein
MIAMAMKSYQSHAELLVKEYLLADPLIPYTSIIGGIFACKMVCFSLSYKKKKMFCSFLLQFLDHISVGSLSGI